MATETLPACEVPAPVAPGTWSEWRDLHATWLYRGILDGGIDDHGLDDDEELAPDGRPPVPERRPVRVRQVGRVPLPDGRLAAGDAYLTEGHPFTQRVPAGKHPCFVALATVAPDHHRVMAAVLVTGDQPVVRWGLGRTDQGDDAPDPAVEEPDLTAGEFFGFPVDAGTAAIFSPLEAVDWFGVVSPDDMDEIWSAIEDGDTEGAVLRGVGGLDVAVFRTGWGDGHYPTWFGYAADDSVSVVVVDCLLFDDPAGR